MQKVDLVNYNYNHSPWGGQGGYCSLSTPLEATTVTVQYKRTCPGTKRMTKHRVQVLEDFKIFSKIRDL